ncbi:hypothetical protein ACVW0I_002035 [Bradyrhizobium sp. LM6.11]
MFHLEGCGSCNHDAGCDQADTQEAEQEICDQHDDVQRVDPRQTPHHELAQREAAEVAVDVTQRHHDAAENKEQVDQ